MRMAGRGGLALAEIDFDGHGKVLQVVGFDGQERGGFIGIELEARVGDQLGAAPVEQASAEMVADDGFTEELVQSNDCHAITSKSASAGEGTAARAGCATRTPDAVTSLQGCHLTSGRAERALSPLGGARRKRLSRPGRPGTGHQGRENRIRCRSRRCRSWTKGRPRPGCRSPGRKRWRPGRARRTGRRGWRSGAGPSTAKPGRRRIEVYWKRSWRILLG